MTGQTRSVELRTGARERARRGPGLVLVLLGCALLVAGALIWTVLVPDRSMAGLPSDDEVVDARRVLMGLPSFEEEQGTSAMVLGDIRTALEVELGPVDWIHDEVRRGAAGCTPPESEIPGALSEGARSRGALPGGGDQGERALEIVEEVAARHGFAETSRFVDGAGDQYADMTSDRGGHVSAMSGDRFGIRVTSDCFLTAEAKAEG